MSLHEMAKIISSLCKEDGPTYTCIPGVVCVKKSSRTPKEKRHWRSTLGLVVQGSKDIYLGRKAYKLSPNSYTVTPISLPVVSQFEATREKPFLAVLIDFDAHIIRELEAKMDEATDRAKPEGRALFADVANEEMQESFLRLVKLFKSPKDAKVLAPLVIREIYFQMLKGSQGPLVRDFVKSDSKNQRVLSAIHHLNEDLEEEIDVTELARSSNMSRSAFFQQFKELTSMSPIQYQKKLRLLEAQRLMLSEGETAEGSAFRVGYKSASQFSREYARMFGASPMKDVAKLKSRP